MSSPPARPSLAAALLCAGLAFAGCAPEPAADADATAVPTPATAEPPADWSSEVESWREERRASLTSEDGWLSLVGLHWLEEGENTIGSGADADLRFPANTPERIGTVRLATPGAGSEAPAEVTLVADPGADLAIEREDAEPVPVEPGTPLVLAPDTSGEPTVLAHGSLTFYLIERGGRYGLRVKDPEGPARTNFPGLDYYPLAPAWRVTARLERVEDMRVAIPNVLGQVEDVRAPGYLVFRAPTGEELRLTPMQEEPGDDLFVVFGDATNGRGTYGGGRFLYAEAPDPTDTSHAVVLDFNRAYNPPCAFTPYATCPLPPDENDLTVAIEAGERSYAGEIPH